MGPLELELKRPRNLTRTTPNANSKVVRINDTSVAGALQPCNIFQQWLASLDSNEIQSLLAVSGSAVGLMNGVTVIPEYDLDALRVLVDELWPPPLPGPRPKGRPQSSRLPVVCAILRVCDPQDGVVFNLSEEFRKLQQDADYRKECGFAGDKLPSRSVFVKSYQMMLRNWSRFRACMVSDPASSIGGGGHEIAEGVLQRLGWDGHIPPQFSVGGNDQSTSAPSRVNGHGRAKSSGLLPVPVVDSVSSNGKDSGEPVERRVYARNWHLYNEAQTNEGKDFLALLGGLADLINLEEARFLPAGGRGRPRIPLGSVIFALVYKAYFGFPARRLHSYLEMAGDQGYLRGLPANLRGADGATVLNSASDAVECRIPKFNTVNYYIRSSWLAKVLLDLITVSALPLRGVENDFAVDGTGWSCHQHERWIDYRLKSESDRHGWVKLHLVTGVKTNIVAAAVVSSSSRHDNVFFPGLVSRTFKHFNVRNVTADMAYLSRFNFELARQLGGKLLVEFKSNTAPARDDGSAWSEALKYFREELGLFKEEYHLRSNVESTNGALKAKFPAKLRSKSFVGHFNELLCKLIAYNIVAVAREVRMRGITPDYPAEIGILEGPIRALVEKTRHPEGGRAAA